MSDPITILQLAEHRLGRQAHTGADFAEAGVAIMGGCKTCHASIAAYNGFPARDGYWRCEDCIGDGGWTDVAEANRDIFGNPPRPTGDTPLRLVCQECGETFTADVEDEDPECPGCGSTDYEVA